MTIPFVGGRRGNTGEYAATFGYMFGSEYTTGARAVYQLYNNSRSGTYYVPSNLVSIAITDELFIGYGAFQNCQDLKCVTLNEGVRELKSYAFAGATALTNAVLPSGVVEIGSYANAANLR